MKTVIVQIHDGQVSLVEQPAGIAVEVRDYSVPDDWEGEVGIDADGDRYEKIVFPAK